MIYRTRYSARIVNTETGQTLHRIDEGSLEDLQLSYNLWKQDAANTYRLVGFHVIATKETVVNGDWIIVASKVGSITN